MKNLFSDFPPVTTKDWEELIKKDLKGVDYDKKLIWKTIENLKFKPYYRNEDLKNLIYLDNKPDNFPFNRTNKIKNNKWEIRQDIIVENIQSANIKANEITKKGVTSIAFVFENDFNISQKEFSELISGIDLNKIEINFISDYKVEELVFLLINEVENQKIKPELIKGSINFDPISYFINTGKFNYSEKEISENIKILIKQVKKKLPNFKFININSCNFANSGANIIQQLAFSLSIATEYISIATDAGIKIDDITPHLKFSFGIGSSYFMEIAKFRAFRYLFSKIIEAYQPKTKDAAKTYIHAKTNTLNKTIYDLHVNMLRTTTEAMSAIIGGIDSLTVEAFDKIYKKPNDFSERIARNQQILLKEEAFLDKIVDISAGSYYIENITDSLIQASWDLFLEIENRGGFIKSFKDNFIQNLIEKTVQKRNMLVATGRQTILGTNKYPNENEKIEVAAMPSISEENATKSETKPLKPYRLAEEFEQVRIKTETNSKTPNVFLFTYGNKTMRKARADFSANFFAVAGFEIINNIGFNTIEDGITECKKQNPDIIVLCSTDDTYFEMASKINNKFLDKIIVIAGSPKNTNELKEIGIKHFVHAKSNILEELKNYQELVF